MSERYYCERCGDVYHEDNIDVCKRCQQLVCPRCARQVDKPDGSSEWVCYAHQTEVKKKAARKKPAAE